jgi:NAD(P)H-flavin reductase
MKIAVIILNHQPVEELLDDLKENYQVDEIINLKDAYPEIMSVFGNVPKDRYAVKDFADTLFNEIDYRYEPDIVVVSGEPRICRYLVDLFEDRGVECYVPYSKRISEDTPQPDGSVKKVTKFQYEGLAEY